MQTLALASGGLGAFAELGDYCRFGTLLTEMQRELAIIIAVRDVHYALNHHVPLALATGITEEQLLLIREGRTPRSLEPAEYALCDYAFEVTACRRVPPRVAEAIHEHFNARQIVDIALLTAYYMSVAALAIGLEVPLETPDVLKVEQDWQRSRLTQPEDPADDAG